MKAIRRLWAGELPVADAFWNWGVIGGIAINLTTSFAFYVLIAVDRPIAAWIVGYAISVPYNIVVAVGIWRAADRDPGDRSRANLYRAIAVIGLTILSVT